MVFYAFLYFAAAFFCVCITLRYYVLDKPLFWAILGFLGYSRLFWGILRCAILGYSGLFWAILSCSRLFWIILG